jgi:hypothetical protein
MTSVPLGRADIADVLAVRSSARRTTTQSLAVSRFITRLFGG